MRLQELKLFSKEQKLTLRYVKRTYPDIIYREGRKQSIDVDAYEELREDRSSNSRKKPIFSPQTQLKRQLQVVEKCDELILASGQEIDVLNKWKSEENDLNEIALIDFQIDDLEESIFENSLRKKASNKKIDLILASREKKEENDQ